PASCWSSRRSQFGYTGASRSGVAVRSAGVRGGSAGRTARHYRSSGDSGRLVVVLTAPARLLSDADRTAVEHLLDRDPYAAAQVAEQVTAFGLAWWRAEARVF